MFSSHTLECVRSYFIRLHHPPLTTISIHLTCHVPPFPYSVTED